MQESSCAEQDNSCDPFDRYTEPETLETLLIGALVNAKVIEALGGKRPGAVDDERLIAAWTHLYRLVLDNPS